MDFQRAIKQAVGRSLAVFMLLAPVAGQQTNPRHPDQDSPELYLSFFFFHEDFAKWTEARMAADPSHSDRILNSSAKYIGVSPSEFATLQKIAGQTAASLRALGDEARVFVQASQKGNGKLDHGALAAFHNRREAIVQAGINQMRGSLSPQSWQGLYSYVNNQHRRHITISPHGNPVTRPPQARPSAP